MRATDLSNVSAAALQEVRNAIARGDLTLPIDLTGLATCGVKTQANEIAAALAGHRSVAALAILDVALAERDHRRPSPELVWTGPEGSSATARDTSVILRALFENARESVILAGYSFDHARDVLEPLHRVMLEHSVHATFFVNIEQAQRVPVSPEAHAAAELGEFVRTNWPFGAPYPRLYYDIRATRPGPPYCSLHAKCVTVDGLQAFISSANFTQRGQDRNIEAGVLIQDPTFAQHLARQWHGLIESGAVAEYRVE
jgi:phosphatidylserine/phosphatidylglycerophosphate/cardiolipin synthase-like enzyme